MTDDVRQVPDGLGGTVTVRVRRDKRLRKSMRASYENGEVLVRIPPRTPEDQLDEAVDKLVERLLKRQTRSRQLQDDYLAERAAMLNKRHFDGQLSWNSIRWVGNMRRRLGSCTNGGPTDGDIRISDRIRGWPKWVIEYVVAHELAHRKYPNHSKAFWAYLNRYPQAERARGFIMGLAFQSGEDAEDWL